LDEFPQDGNYQKFILENYTEVVKERIIEGFEANDWTNEQRMNRIIRANEILQNRLLKTTYTNEMNIAIILEGLARRKKNRGLVYVTAEYFRYGQRKAILMVRPDLNESDCYLEEIDVGLIQLIVSQFFQAGQGRKQKFLLSKLGSQLKILKKIVESNNLLIVPNSLFLKIPLHMIRINGKFLFETTRISYWPSLKFAKYANEKNHGIFTKTCLIYTSKEKMAIKEANRIRQILPDSIALIDPTKKEIIQNTKKADIIHVIANQSRGKICFNKYEYETNEFLRLIGGSKNLIVMNVCGSGVSNTEGPPIAHQSIAHLLMEKNSNIISHNWDLSQTSSYSFSSSFYKSLVNQNSIIKSFAKSLGTLKNNSPILYGGYMLWDGTSI
jgi:hypothetical protein